jgi:hypothetical protein
MADLQNYESVAERIEKFWIHYPMGRIETKLIFQDGSRYIVQTDLYRDVNDVLPFATDFAEEVRSNSNRFPMENCATSSIGRSLHTGGISKFSEGIPRPSLQEMQNYDNVIAAAPVVEIESRDPWSFKAEVTQSQIVAPPASPARCPHGSMTWKEGVGKTGKPYSGWTCPEMDRSKQCKAIWL